MTTAHIANALAAAADAPANAPTGATPGGGSVTLSAGVVVLAIGFVIVKTSGSKFGWVLIAVAFAMLSGTQIGQMVVQMGGQLAVSAGQAAASLAG